MKLSYCIFSAQYLPTMGGVERYTYNLSKKLREKGADVTIVTSKIKNYKDFEIIDGISVYRLPSLALLNGRFPVVLNNNKTKRVLKKLAAMNFNEVIINTRFYPLSLLGAKFAFKNSINRFVIDHGTSHLTINNSVFDKLGEGFEHFITNKIKKYCSNFYGVSKSCNEWLLHFGIKAKGTIYNAVNIEEIQKIAPHSENAFRTAHGINSDDIVISFAGRLIKEKGVLNLIEAVEKIVDTRKDIFLLIAGDGPLKDDIKKLETKNIKCVGKLNFEDIIPLFKSSDIFCLPSKSEGFPTSVIEAAACKCFIITTKKGGSSELINNKDLGIIMNSSSSDEIYKNLKDVIDDKNYRENAAQLCYERLQKNFTWDIISQKVIDIALEKED